MAQLIFILLPIALLNRLRLFPIFLSIVLLLFSSLFPAPFFRGGIFVCLVFSIANSFHIQAFQSSLSWRSLKLLKSIAQFRDSLKEVPYRYFLLMIGALLFSIYVPMQSISTSSLLILTAILSPQFIYSFIRKKEQAHSGYVPAVENEHAAYTSKDHPLEKCTEGFYGEELFSLPGKRPHVITIFLESFRAENVGALGSGDKITENFDALTKEGIFFTNFHSNATLSFKALFHFLYGLPAAFGSEFKGQAKKALRLNLSGLPDIFKNFGYELFYLQGGDATFDHVKPLLKNHGYDQVYDRKDILKSYPDAQQTSWGVHDEYIYKYFLEKLKISDSPLFAQIGTLTNHHPFKVPKDYAGGPSIPAKDPLYNSFLKSMHYTDAQLGKFVEEIKKSAEPVHLYIFGDHGFDKEDIKTLNQSIKKSVTHVPLLILPLNCGEVTSTTITDVCSTVDLLPTMMDIYGLKGVNSSTGSSLRRRRENPHAIVFNQIPETLLSAKINISGGREDVDKDLFPTLTALYEDNAISSSEKNNLLYLDFSEEKITMARLSIYLQKEPNLRSLILNDCMLITDLSLPFPESLKKISLDGNLFISDEDLKYLPSGIESISILGCIGIGDKGLETLKGFSLKKLCFTAVNFSTCALNDFASSLDGIESIVTDGGAHLTEEFFENLPTKTLTDLRVKNSWSLGSNFLRAIGSHPLKNLLLSNCTNISDEDLQALSKTKIECLLLEKAHNITCSGLFHLKDLPLQVFSISEAKSITDTSIQKLNSSNLQRIFCIACGLEEKSVEISCGNILQRIFYVDEPTFLSKQKELAFTQSEMGSLFSL